MYFPQMQEKFQKLSCYLAGIIKIMEPKGWETCSIVIHT